MFEIIAIQVVVGAIVVASVWIAAALAWNDLQSMFSQRWWRRKDVRQDR